MCYIRICDILVDFYFIYDKWLYHIHQYGFASQIIWKLATCEFCVFKKTKMMLLKNRQWQFVLVKLCQRFLGVGICCWNPKKSPMAIFAARNLCNNVTSCSPWWVCMPSIYLRWGREEEESLRRGREKERKKKRQRLFFFF